MKRHKSADWGTEKDHKATVRIKTPMSNCPPPKTIGQKNKNNTFYFYMTIFHIINFFFSLPVCILSCVCVLSATPLFSYLSPQTQPDVAEDPSPEPGSVGGLSLLKWSFTSPSLKMIGCTGFRLLGFSSSIQSVLNYIMHPDATFIENYNKH